MDKTHLQRYDNHKDLLVLVGEDVLDEGPASSYEHNGDEQHGALEQVSNIVEDGPGLHMLSTLLNEVIVDRVEHQREGLEEHQHGHQIVNFVYRVPVVGKDIEINKKPETRRKMRILWETHLLFFRINTQKRPERKKSRLIMKYKAGSGISPADK